MADLKEIALNFGPAAGLVGILARGTGEDASDLAVVILNAGILHRVGPHRLHVRLARELAEHGVPTLRMDLPGIGDSRSTEPDASILEESVHAVAMALDTLEKMRVARRFIAVGLCSGADHAFRIACADARVVGLVLIDPTRIFPTWQHYVRRVMARTVQPVAWLRLLAGRYHVLEHLRRWLRPVPPPPPVAEPVDPAALAPPTGIASATTAQERATVERTLVGLLARGLRVCYVITGTQRHLYSYRGQIAHTFPGIGLEKATHVEFLPDAIHTFPREASRVRLADAVVAWVTTTPFPGGTIAKSTATRPAESPPAEVPSLRTG